MHCPFCGSSVSVHFDFLTYRHVGCCQGCGAHFTKRSDGSWITTRLVYSNDTAVEEIKNG